MGKGFKYIPRVACDHDIWKSGFVSNVIWEGGDMFSRSTISFTMMRLGMFFVVSQTLRFCLKPLHQSQFVCNLLAGIALGNTGLGKINKYAVMKDSASQLMFGNLASMCGLLYQVFIITVKIDMGRMLKSGKNKKPRIIGLSAVLAPMAAMVLLDFLFRGMTFKDGPNDKFRTIFQCSLSSTMNVTPALEDLHLLTTEVGQLALSSALVSEMLFVVFWSASIIVTSVNRGPFKSLLPLSGVILIMVFVLMPAMKWMIKTTHNSQSVKEIYAIGVLLAAGIVASLWDVTVGTPLLGIILFGITVPSGPPLGSAVVDMGEIVVKTCFLPFFFMALGDMVNLAQFDDLRPHIAYEVMLVVGYTMKGLATVVAAMVFDINLRKGMTLGFILNSSGLSETMFALMYWWRQKIDPNLACQLVLSSLIRGALAAPMSMYCYRLISHKDETIPGFELSIQSIPVTSKMQILACVDNEEEVPGIISLLEASNPTSSCPISAYVVHFTELTGDSLPTLAHHKKHTAICKHNGCVHIMNAFKRYTEIRNGSVLLQLLSLIVPFGSMHDGLSRLALDKLIPLVIVPFFYKSQGTFRRDNNSREINLKLLAQAPCTVGIFVDKGLATKHRNDFLCKIMVFFFGGEDDREVLAYAARMSGHPGVSITAWQIVVHADQHDESTRDRLLDETLLNAFKTKISDNACAIFREVHVRDWEEAFQRIQSPDNDYDLAMVGRRNDPANLEDEQISALIQPELGCIGTTLASTESKWQATSVLVLQHCVGMDRDMISNLMTLEDDLC